MTDYQQGKIYSIRSPSTDKIYIGSTVTTLCKRFYQHKKKSNTTATEIIALGDAYIELIELYPCGSKIELNKREGEIQREQKPLIVNHRMEGQTLEELKTRRVEYKQEYYAENSDRLKEKAKNYYVGNANQIIEYQKKYYAENKEKVDKRMKEYREANKEQIKEKKRQKRRERKLEKKAENLK